MAIIPHWLVTDERTATRQAELAERLARLEKHRRLALVELRQLEGFLAAHPDLRKWLPGTAQGQLRLVVDNVNNKQVRRLPLRREHLDGPDGPDEAA
jgi:hypothetical protein